MPPQADLCWGYLPDTSPLVLPARWGLGGAAMHPCLSSVRRQVHRALLCTGCLLLIVIHSVATAAQSSAAAQSPDATQPPGVAPPPIGTVLPHASTGTSVVRGDRPVGTIGHAPLQSGDIVVRPAPAVRADRVALSHAVLAATAAPRRPRRAMAAGHDILLDKTSRRSQSADDRNAFRTRPGIRSTVCSVEQHLRPWQWAKDL
jgi:hypothetical protein